MAAIVGGEIERTIEGASTLTLELHDPDQKLLNGKLLMGKEPVDVKFDRFWFRLVRTSKQGTTLTLTFEDREVSLMRLITKPRQAYRDKMTRAEFILSMLLETKGDDGRKVKIPYYIPELHVRQDITGGQEEGRGQDGREGQGQAVDRARVVAERETADEGCPRLQPFPDAQGGDVLGGRLTAEAPRRRRCWR